MNTHHRLHYSMDTRHPPISRVPHKAYKGLDTKGKRLVNIWGTD